jgi:hypothetical protein
MIITIQLQEVPLLKVKTVSNDAQSPSNVAQRDSPADSPLGSERSPHDNVVGEVILFTPPPALSSDNFDPNSFLADSAPSTPVPTFRVYVNLISKGFIRNSRLT